MPVDIVVNNVIGDIATGRTEIPGCPTMSAPVRLAEFWKLFLKLARGASLGELDDMGHRHGGRNRDEHVNMITANYSGFDAHSQLLGNLGNEIPNPLLHRGGEHPIPVLGDPNQLIAVVVNRVAGAIIRLHACYATRSAGVIKLKFTHLKMGV